MQMKLTCYVEADVLKAVRHAAVDQGVTIGAVVEAALIDALKAGGDVAADVLNRGPAGALPVARKARKAGADLAQIAADLNRDGYRTARGKPWSVVAVSRLLKTA